MTINTMKQIVLIQLLFAATVQAQSLKPEAVSTTSGIMTQSNGSLTFTVGELIMQGFTDSQGNTLGNGFTESVNGSTQTVAIEEPPKEIIDLRVYPNPGNDFVKVDILSTRLNNFSLQVFDVTGNRLLSDSYNGISKQIMLNTSDWASGVYFLKLLDDKNKMQGHYKIIKN